MNLTQLILSGPKLGTPTPPEWAGLTPARIAQLKAWQAKTDAAIDEVVRHLRQHGEMSTTNLASDLKLTTTTIHSRCAKGLEKGLLIKETRWTSNNRRNAGCMVTFWRAA